MTGYLDRTLLEVTVVDDSAPVDLDERETKDMVGVARVPLRGLLLDDHRVEGRFEI